VAQIAAVRRPERVSGVVLCNSIAYDSWPIPSVTAMRAIGRLVERAPLGLFLAAHPTVAARAGLACFVSARGTPLGYSNVYNHVLRPALRGAGMR
jgi:pimeloyl-ACP methyl ester carboxylesterase